MSAPASKLAACATLASTDNASTVARTARDEDPSPLLSACRRLPNELLNDILRRLFQPDAYIRDRIRVGTTLSLVCKAWESVVEPIVFDTIWLHPQDAQAISYLDPDRSASGAHRLSHARRLYLSTTYLRGDFSEDETAIEQEDDQDEDRIQHAWLENPSANTRAGCASILMHTPGIRHLALGGCAADFATSAMRVFQQNAGRLAWTALSRLLVIWPLSVTLFLPIARCLPSYPISHLSLVFPERDEPDDDLADQAASMELPAILGIQTLKELDIGYFRPVKAELDVLLDLISPEAPLSNVTWCGRVSKALLKKLGEGSSPMQQLMFGGFDLQDDLQETILPCLQDLGSRPIRFLVFSKPDRDFDTEDEDADEDVEEDFTGPPATMLMQAVPPTIKFIDSMGITGGAPPFIAWARDETLLNISRNHPPVPFLFSAPSQTYNEKPLAQMVWLKLEGQEPDSVSVFARFGDADEPGTLTGWRCVVGAEAT
ncbi:hypothetical protein JCM10908_003661 [Rhodotorula pacifica]|uniref:F-box protein n=1 Tax=Rhodotorula pacifica TaxID=1495444 RepID=UPI00316B3D16